LLATAAGEKINRTQKIRESEEYDRVLYVALTRAKTAVTLIWGGKKPEAKTWAARLWKPPEGETKHSQFKTLFQKNEKILLPLQTTRSFAQQELLPPLQLAQAQKSEQKSVTEMISSASMNYGKNRIRQIEIAEAGINAHRIFESLKYRPQLKDLTEQQQKAVAFLQNWQQGKVQQWIDQGEVEWGFCIEHAGRRIQGQIDLWANHVQGGVVVDYKTGSEEYLEKAYQQLEIYAWALRKMGKFKENQSIELVVIYPMAEKVHSKKSDPAYQPDL
jgi:ATP-dependent helicase/nuclease subunit A